MSQILLAAACAAVLALAALLPQPAAGEEEPGGLFDFLRGLFGMETAPKDAYKYAVVARSIDLDHGRRIVDDAAKSWTEINPGMTFMWVEDDGLPADIIFRFEPLYDVDTIGIGEQDYYDDPYTIRIKPTIYDCKGSQHPLTDDAMLFVATWGIGYSLGLANHTSEDHLMYGINGQFPYNSLGYVIPDHPWTYESISEVELLAEYDRIVEEYDARYAGSYTEMFNDYGMTYEQLAAEYDEAYTDRHAEFDKVLALLDGLNRKIVDIDKDLEALYAQYENPPTHLENPLINDYNQKVELYNAYADSLDEISEAIGTIEEMFDVELDIESAEIDAIADEWERIETDLNCLYDEVDAPTIKTIPAY